MYWNLVVIPFFIPVFIVYIIARHKNDLKTIAVAQPICTALAVACAVLGFLAPQTSNLFNVLITMGLIISACADTRTIDIDGRDFLFTATSIFSFAIAFYAAAYIVETGVNMITVYTGIVMLVIFILILIFQWKGIKENKISVVIYSAAWWVLLTMVAASFSGTMIGRTRSILITAGIVLFFVSDSITSIHAFMRPMPKSLIAASYGAGQLLIALGLGY